MTEATTLNLPLANAALVPDENSASGMRVTAVSAPTIQAMIGQAVAAGNLDMVGKLMDYQDRYDAKMARRAFDLALAAAKAEIPLIKKNRTVDFTNKDGKRTHYKHEDLGEIIDVVGPILARQGLFVRFATKAVPNEPVTVTCILTHSDGHSVENSLTAGRDTTGNKNDHQAIASAVTYLQRYTLKAALGLAAAADDDGKEAGGDLDEPAYITTEQAKGIEDRCANEGVNVDKLCLHLKVTAVENILAKEYDSVIRTLNQRKAEKELRAKKKLEEPA